jgi:hypothetical protein
MPGWVYTSDDGITWGRKPEPEPVIVNPYDHAATEWYINTSTQVIHELYSNEVPRPLIDVIMGYTNPHKPSV